MPKSDVEELHKLLNQARHWRMDEERLKKQNKIAKYLERAEERINIQDTTIEKLWEL